MIPRLVEHYGAGLNGRCGAIRRALGIETSQSLAEALDELMADWPIPKTLSALGVEVSALSKAAALAASDRAIGNGPMAIGQREIRTLLEQAH